MPHVKENERPSIVQTKPHLQDIPVETMSPQQIRIMNAMQPRNKVSNPKEQARPYVEEDEMPSVVQMIPHLQDTSVETLSPQQIRNIVADALKSRGELVCRITIAQIIKDVNYPYNPLPIYVSEASKASLRYVSVSRGLDTVHLLRAMGAEIA